MSRFDQLPSQARLVPMPIICLDARIGCSCTLFEQLTAGPVVSRPASFQAVDNFSDNSLPDCARANRVRRARIDTGPHLMLEPRRHRRYRRYRQGSRFTRVQGQSRNAGSRIAATFDFGGAPWNVGSTIVLRDLAGA
jgi:hypothetical protein